jgi:hypothetical protein
MAGRGDIEAGRAYVELLLKGEAFAKGLEGAKDQLKKFSGGVAAIGAALLAAGGALRGSLLGALAVFAEGGEELDILSKRTGIAVDSLSELGFAARRSGTDLDTVVSAIKHLQTNLGSADLFSKDATETFRLLGLSVGDLLKMSPEGRFQAVADALAGIPDDALRAKLAFDVFGKSAFLLTEMLQNLRALRQEARELRLVTSPEDAKLAREVAEGFKVLKELVGQVTSTIGSALAPAFLKTVDIFKRALVQIDAFISKHKELIVMISGLSGVLITLGGALLGLTTAVKILQFAFSGVVTVISLVISTLSLLLTPMGAVVAVIGAATFAFFRFTKAGQDAAAAIGGILADMLADFKTTFGGISDAISAGDFALAGQIAMTGLRLAMLEGWDAIKNGADKAWQAIKIVFLEATAWVADIWQAAWVKIKDYAEAAWTWLQEGLVRFLFRVKAVWVEQIDSIKIVWLTVWGSIKQFFANTVADLIDDLKSFVEFVPGAHEALVAFGGVDERDWDKTSKLLRQHAADTLKDRDAAVAAAQAEQAEILKTRDTAIKALKDKRDADAKSRQEEFEKNVADRQKIIDDAKKTLAAPPGEDPEVTRLKKQLDDLTKQAAEEKERADKERERKEKEKPPPKPPPGEEGGIGGFKAATVVTFSGAAAALAGGSSSDHLKKMSGQLQVIIVEGQQNTRKITDAIAGNVFK